MTELLLLLLVLGTVALAIAWPLLDARSPAGSPAAAPAGDPEGEAMRVRHRLAMEALRDVQADHRAGSLDDEAYEAQRNEAEEHAAETLRALDAAPDDAPSTRVDSPRTGRSLAAVLGAALALLVLVGYALPSPFGLAERDARVERIRQLTDTVAANPRDTTALAELSDLYLAAGTSEGVARALASLLLLRDAAPESRDAHQRLVTLLIRAGLWEQAAPATDRFAEVVGEDDPDIPFFRGLIARGSGDLQEARRQFDRFLRLAPDDPRATMVQGLREEAAESGG